MTPLDIDTGTTSWVLASAALVLLMTPGLAFFYGGMVRAKSVLNMMMMSFGALASISVIWVLWGYSMAFGDEHRLRPARQPAAVLRSEGPDGRHLRSLRRQMALPGDGVRRLPGRVRHHHRRPDLRCHRRSGQVQHLDDLHRHLGHSGLLPGRPLGVRLRRGQPRRRLARQQPARRSTSPVARPSTSTPVPPVWRWPSSWASGSAGGATRCDRTTSPWSCSARACSGSAGSASTPARRWPPTTPLRSVWVNTMVATGAACLGWLVTERIRDGHATSLGAASGVVAGLVAITPSCSSVSPDRRDHRRRARRRGLRPGDRPEVQVRLRRLARRGRRPPVGGLWGTLAVGFLAHRGGSGRWSDGLFYGGGFDQLWRQAVGALAVLLFSLHPDVRSSATILHKTIGFRV